MSRDVSQLRVLIPKIIAENLSMVYLVREGTIKAVSNVNFNVYEGRITALIGESGSGKTSLIETIMRTLPRNAKILSGRVLLRLSTGESIDLIKASDSLMRRLRGRVIGYVPQGAQNSLNPVLTVKQHFYETLKDHGLYNEKSLEEIYSILKLVRLDPDEVLGKYPHELSGGMKQRVVVALTMILKPEIVVLDEPTSALDVFSQRILLNILYAIHSTYKNTMLLITHDLPIAVELADRIAVLYAGTIVEEGYVYEIFKEPLHPYTSMLISAIPSVIDVYTRRKPRPIPGEPPSLLNPPRGCKFHPRCPFARDICRIREPPEIEVSPGRRVKCWLYADKSLGSDR